MTSTTRLRAWFAPIDAAPLLLLRVSYGATLAAWVVYQWVTGLAYEHYLGLALHLSFDVPLLGAPPALGDTAVVVLLDAIGALGVSIAVGLCSRVASLLGAAAMTYLFLLEKSLYQNHLYLLCMLGVVVAAMPIHDGWSVGRLLRRRAQVGWAPAWALWLARAQIGVVYVGGALAKLNADWLHARPVHIWTEERADWPVVGALLGSTAAPWVIAYFGLVFDALVVPGLLWGRTRTLTTLCVIVFHLSNAALWEIDVFPWLMLPLTLLFFPPGWLRARAGLPALALPPLDDVAPSAGRARALLSVLALHAAVQIALPLRHFVLFPGDDPMWSEQGHRFSWRMMLRWKESDARFFVVEPDRDRLTWEVDAQTRGLRPFQYELVINHPDALHSYCAWLAAELERERGTPVEIHVVDEVVLNGHPPALLVDPAADLAHAPAPSPWAKTPWIVGREDAVHQAAARAEADRLARAAERAYR